MAFLQHALELLEFKTMDEVTPASLKRSFKKKILVSHPDKGGNESDFDMLLSSYLYLSETMNRLSGGRATLQNINAPDEIKESRANQLINEVFEEFEKDRLEELFRTSLNETGKYSRVKVNEAFHEHFEKCEQTKGYGDWLVSHDANGLYGTDGTDGTDGLYGTNTIKPSINNTTELNHAFENIAKTSCSTLMLHPDEMAYHTGGVSLIDASDHNYTSVPGSNPGYTDLYNAFTTENTIIDKIPILKTKTLEELLEERERVYEHIRDEELEAIGEYERKKIDADKKHKNSIQQYFEGSTKLLDEKVGFCIMIGK